MNNKKSPTIVRLFLLAPPNALTRFWTSNQATYFACKHAQQKEFLAKFFPLFTLRVSSLLLRLKFNKKANKKQTADAVCFSLAPPAGLELS